MEIEKPDNQRTWEELEEEACLIKDQMGFNSNDKEWQRIWKTRLEEIAELQKRAKSIVSSVYE